MSTKSISYYYFLLEGTQNSFRILHKYFLLKIPFLRKTYNTHVLFSLKTSKRIMLTFAFNTMDKYSTALLLQKIINKTRSGNTCVKQDFTNNCLSCIGHDT